MVVYTTEQDKKSFSQCSKQLTGTRLSRRLHTNTCTQTCLCVCYQKLLIYQYVYKHKHRVTIQSCIRVAFSLKGIIDGGYNLMFAAGACLQFTVCINLMHPLPTAWHTRSKQLDVYVHNNLVNYLYKIP